MSSITNISAVIITYNEQEHIARCVQSLQGIADEIVIMDSDSADDTVAIAAKLGARVINTEWSGYAETKNKGNEQATYDYILSIDADEELSDELRTSLQALKKIGFKENAAYTFNRLNNYCGQWIRYAGWYPDTKERLFDRRYTKWEGEVHEQLVHAQEVITIKVKGDLLHYSIKDKADHIARIHKYNKLARKYPNRLVAYLSAISTFIKLYVVKSGFLDGALGFQLCLISAKAKIWR